MQVKPHIAVLNEHQLAKIHEDSLCVLSQTGVRVDSDVARQVMLSADGITLHGDHVHISVDVVNWALQQAPASIDIFNRDSEPAFKLGKDQQNGTIYGIGVTNSWYQHPENDELTPFAREHVSHATALGNTLDQFDLISTPGVIQGDESDFGEMIASLEMLANTSKPLVLLCSDTVQFKATLNMFAELCGDLSNKPFILPYFNPITPLVLNQDTTDKMITTIEHGLPLIFSSYGMSGATAPIGGEGTLILLNAELLAGLVFSQLVKPGTPVVLGSLPSLFEMQNMFSAYTAQTMLVNLACAELMDYYGIPHAGTSGSGTGWGSDLLASGTLWMNHLTSSMGKVGLAPFVGGNFDSQAFSPTTVVYANEVIRQVRQLSAGFQLDASSATLDEISSIGPGGSFLTAPGTLAQFRELHEQHSQIWPGYAINQWLSEGSPDGLSILRNQTSNLMENLKIPSDHEALITKGEAFIQELSA